MQIECARIKHQDGIEDLCRFQVAVSRSFVKCGRPFASRRSTCQWTVRKQSSPRNLMIFPDPRSTGVAKCIADALRFFNGIRKSPELQHKAIKSSSMSQRYTAIRVRKRETRTETRILPLSVFIRG